MRSRQSLFTKSVALTLSFTFLYSQLLWAVDPRQMLLLAKKSFEMEDQARMGGTSAAEVELTQEQKQALVDQKNELDALSQKQQFSLTTANGDILRYVDGKLRRIDRPDGTSLKNIKLGTDGSVQSADIKLSDGSLQIYDNGKVLGYRLPNGGQALYEGGVLTKVISKQGQETTYTYIKDTQGKVIEIILENSDSKAWYTPEGKIKQSYSKKDSATSSFQNGIIRQIQRQDGSILIFQEQAIDTTKKIFLTEQSDPLNPFQYALYRQDNSLKEIRDKQGRKIEFDAQGLITRVTDADGKEVNFDFAQSSLSTIVSSQIKQNGVSSRYDADGRLSAVQVDGLVIHYKEDQNGSAALTIDYIEKSDGTEIHNLVFDVQGNLKDALFITPDGEERTYKDGKLLSIKKPDYTRIFYFDDKPTKLITAQKLTYNFTYTPQAIEARLDSSIVPDATTAIQMNYATDFSLRKMIRQNKEALSFLDNELKQIDFPDSQAPQVFAYNKDTTGKLLSYAVTQGNVQTTYDPQNNPLKTLVSKTTDNPNALEVLYQYGKIRQIKKNDILTFKYSYSFDSQSKEITTIDDLEEKTTKDYREGLLLASLNQETSVLSTYEYVTDKVSKVTVTRLGRALHTYAYSYKDDLTIVQDEEGVIRTYGKDKKLTFLEKDNEKFTYSYNLNADKEEIVEEMLIERKLSNGARAFYDQGKLTSILLADGTQIQDLVKKGDNTLDKATLLLKDGTKLIFSSQAVLEEILTDNAHFWFENNKLKKVLTPQGEEYLYSYDSQNKTYLDYKNLILHYDPQDNLLGTKIKDIQALIEGTHDFLDEAAPSRTITSSGGVALTSSQPKFGRGALSMPGGQSDYLKVPASTDFDFGTGDFTIEFSANFSQVSNCVLFDRDGGRAGYTFELYNGRLYWTDNNSGSKKNEAWSPNVNTWYHLAVTRQNSQLHFYANGQELGSGTAHTTNLTYAPTDLYIGTNASGNLPFNGSLDEVRISKGAARYTSNFTPPTSAFQTDSQTKLLLHFDGVDNAYLSFKDNVLSNPRSSFTFDSLGKLSSSSFNSSDADFKTIQDNSNLSQKASIKNQAILDPNNKRIGNASLSLDGQDDAVIVKNNPSFNFKKEDFTVEFFVKFDEIKTGFFFSRWANLMDMVYGTSGNLYFILGGQDVKVQPFNPQLNAWYHLAVERDKGQMRLFLDGKESGTPTPNDTNIDYSEDLWLGIRANMAEGFHGHLDELRISKGVARYTQDFVPSTQGFTPDVNTVLLLHFDDEQRKTFEKTRDVLGTIPPAFVKTPVLPYKAKKQRQDPDHPAWASLASDSILDRGRVISQEYSSKGDLETQTKADQTVTLFEQNKPSKVLDKGGNILIEYSYDTDGNLLKVYLKNARAVLPGEVLKAKEAIQGQRSNTLLELAKQKNLAYQTIQDQVKDQKKALQDQLGSLQGQYNSISSVSVSGKKAKGQKGDALNQIGGAMGQVRGALASLESQEADAYAKLDSQIKILSDQIEADSQKAFQELANQETQLKKEILKQEISPIVYDYYRRILGRDPTSVEYGNWIGKTDYDTGKFITGYDSHDEIGPGASVRLDGSGDNLNVAGSNDFSFGTGDFTIEFFLKFSSISNGVLFDRDFGRTGYTFELYNGRLYWTDNNTGNKKNESWSPSANTWYHLAVARKGQTLHFFVDGAELGSGTTHTSDINSSQALYVGSYPSGASAMNIWVEEFRISKGLARYAQNFTVPTERFKIDDATALLLRPAKSEVGAPIKDFSASQKTVLVSGDTKTDKDTYKLNDKVTITIPILTEVTKALKDYLSVLPELAERKNYVSSVKAAVTDKINQYLKLSQADKETFAKTLGLSSNELINLTSQDAQKILIWLNARSLHFGQSAFLSLESLLDQKGFSYAREDIAWKSILIDILTGVITPLDDGDLVISMYGLNKVAGLYGLTLAGANISWDDLLKIYQANPTSKMIVHVNGNHYLVVQAMDANSITYMDPGAGKDKQNQIQTISKADFLKAWRGNVTLESTILSSSTVQNPSSKILSVSQTQKIRGAFFFLLIPVIFAAVANIGGAVWAAANGIGAIIAAAGSIIGSALNIAWQGLTALANGIGYIGHALWQGISFAASSLFHAIGNVASFLSQTVFGSIAKAGFGHALFQTAVKVGINFAVSRGLESLGVNSTIANLASAFVTGGVSAGFNAGFAASGFIISGLKAVALQGTQTLLQKVGLDTTLSQTLALVISPFIDGIQQGNIGGNLVKIVPNLAQNLSFYGIEKLGTSLGLDPRISTLIGAPISAGIGAAVSGGKDVGVNIVNSVQAGLAQGVIAYGLRFTGTSNPILGSLLSWDVTNNLAKAIGREGLFSAVFNVLRKTALNMVNVVGGVGKTVFEGITSFGNAVQQKGLVGALESLATSAFSRGAQEAILQKGGVQGLFDSTPRTSATLRDGRSAKELKIDEKNSLFFDDVSRLIGRKDEGIYQLGDFGYDSFGNFALLDGNAYSDMGNDLGLQAGVRDGQLTSVKIDGPKGTLLQIDPEKNKKTIFIEGPKPNQPSQPFNFWGSVFKLAPLGLSLFMQEGVANAGQISGSGAVGQSAINNSTTTLYALVNGILNKELDSTKSPDYINNFESDIAGSSNGQYIAGRDFMKSAIYQGFGIPVVDQAKDIMNLFFEATSPVIYFASAIKIMMDFDNRLNSVPSDKTRPIVAMGYSGGFLPLVEAIQQRHYNTDTLIGLGAATTAPLNVPFDDISKILNYILLGQMGNAVKTLTKYLVGIKDISQLGIKRAVNVWGTNDILYQMGIAGKRDSIGGIKTYNIEIAGATHFDYMRRSDETDPVKKAFNKTVSDFVVELTKASNSDATLLEFLQRTLVAPDADGVWRFRP